ncbi:MAG: tellurite resistance TerB family protein [Sulfuriferula sp.]
MDSEFRIPPAPAGYGEAKWIPHGQAVTIAGMIIPDGMIYVGINLKSRYGSDPCQIDPSKSVAASSGNFTERQFGYWPSYSDISATARRAYLNWLAGGRSHPDTDIGYVFLFFYGLERRVIIDASKDSTILADYPDIAQEIRRLLSIYGGKSRSFQGYARGLLDWVSLGPLKNNKLYLEPIPELSKTFELPLYIRLALGMAAVDGFPVPKHLACAWSKLDPSIVMRTPAKRCPEYYDKLFELKYTEIFGSGMILPPNRTKLKVIYRPASAGFRGVNNSVLTRTFSNVPDVSILTGPLKKLQQVVHAVNNELDPYSRSVAKNVEAKNTLDSLIYLPVALWPDEIQKALSELKSKVDQGSVTLLFQELLLKLNGNTTLSKEKTVALARVLESVSIGMEPDVLGAAKAPKAEDTVVLFAKRSGNELPRTNSAYQAALLTLQLSSAVAMADGEFSATEMDYLQEQINLWTHLSASHQRRLIAHLNLLKSAPASFAGLKRKFEPLSLSERESIAAFLATVAQSDGEALPAEVDTLKKIYKAIGVDPNKVFSDIHAVASGTKPASATTSKEETGFTLNAERIAQLQRESEKVSTLLADIFKEEEPVSSNHPAPESATEIAAVDDSPRLLGLDESHTALARMLLSRPQWSREDLLDVAADLDLMLDGALEHINEASFDIYDTAFTDGEDPIMINLEIFEKIEL